MAQRRTPRRTPGTRAGGAGNRPPGSPRGPRPARARTTVAQPAPRAVAPVPRRPRFTGRAVVLVLVLTVLAVSYASSMRAYFEQRSHISDLKQAIAEREASIDDLEREKRRWQDPAYVKAQARERFGYLMPGQTGFQVLDEDGEPLESRASLHDPDEVVRTQPTPWWSDAWDSMELAGHPPKPGDGPAEKIDGTRQ